MYTRQYTDQGELNREMLDDGILFLSSAYPQGVLAEFWMRVKQYVLGVHYTNSGVAVIATDSSIQATGMRDSLNPPSRSLTANLTNRAWRNLSARVSRTLAPLQTIANDTSQRVKEAAELSTKLLDQYDRPDGGMRRSVIGLIEYSAAYGSAFMKVQWDASKGRVVRHESFDDVGNPVVGSPYMEGDVTTEAIPPWELWVDNPGATRIDEVSMIAHVRYISKIQAKVLYGVDCEETAQSEWQYRYLWEDPRIWYSRHEQMKQRARIAEVYRRCRHPESGEFGWWRCFIIGDKLLEISEGVSVDFVNELPFVRFCFHGQNIAWYGVTPMQSTIDIQYAINRAVNQADHAARLCVNRIIVPSGMGTPEIKDQNGQILEVQDTDQIRDWHGAPIPQTLMAYIGWLEHMFEVVTGVSAVSEGQSGGGASSGYAIERLQSAEQGQADPVVQNLDACRIESARILLQTLRDKAPKSMLMAKISTDEYDAVNEFNSVELGDNFNVELRIEKGLPRDPTARRAELNDMFRAGILSPQNKDDRALYFRAIDMPSGRDVNPEFVLQTKAAERCISKILALPVGDAAFAVQLIASGSPSPLDEILVPQPEQDPVIWHSVFEKYLVSTDVERIAKEHRDLLRARFIAIDSVHPANAQPAPTPGQQGAGMAPPMIQS